MLHGAILQSRREAFKRNFRLNLPHKNLTKFVIYLFKVIVLWGRLNRNILRGLAARNKPSV